MPTFASLFNRYLLVKKNPSLVLRLKEGLRFLDCDSVVKNNGSVVLLLHRVSPALLSPQVGLTSEFGMESGGTLPLKTLPNLGGSLRQNIMLRLRFFFFRSYFHTNGVA